MRFSQNKDAI